VAFHCEIQNVYVHELLLLLVVTKCKCSINPIITQTPSTTVLHTREYKYEHENVREYRYFGTDKMFTWLYVLKESA
jgi:hypothetical protein